MWTGPKSRARREMSDESVAMDWTWDHDGVGKCGGANRREKRDENRGNAKCAGNGSELQDRSAGCAAHRCVERSGNISIRSGKAGRKDFATAAKRRTGR